MKKNLRILLIAVCSTLGLTAQPSIQWQKCLGGSAHFDWANSIIQTTEGGYIVAGGTASNDGDVSGNHGTRDVWLVKLNSLGVIQWQRCWGGTDEEYALSIRQTSDGGYIVAGSSQSIDGNISGHHGQEGVYDYWVVKLNSSGFIQWQKCLGGTKEDYAYSIQQTSDDGYIVAGWTKSYDGDVTGNHGDIDYWVVKLNSSGAIQWQKCLGGTNADYAYSIQQTSDDGYIVAGYVVSNDGDVSGNHGGGDCWIVKLNSFGVLQWQKCLGGTNAEYAFAIQQTSDSGFIVAGYSLSNDGDVTGNDGGGDYWVVKLNSSGAIQWQKCFGGTNDDYAYSIQQTSDGGYIVAGYAVSNDGDVTGNHGSVDSWIVKLSSSGGFQWQKCLGGTGSDRAYSIHQTTGGGYIVAGSSSSNDGDVSGNHGQFTDDFWIVKLSSGIGVEEINHSFSDLQISPNPVSNSTTISFSLSQSENLSVSVYDITGRLVKNLFAGKMNSGSHELKWDVSGENRIDDGVYFLNFVGTGFSHSSKIVVVK